jgi:hypothetical protein
MNMYGRIDVYACMYVHKHKHACVYVCMYVCMCAIAHGQHARRAEGARGAGDGLNVAAGLFRVAF